MTLTAAGISTNLGITRQWQSASSCGGPWTNIAAATGPTLTTTQTATTSYRMLVTCTFTSQSTPSNCITVTGASGVILPVITSVTANPTPVCFNGSTTLTANTAAIAGNYTLSSIPYAPISPPGSTIAVPIGDDVLSGIIPIGFNFTFYGNTYTNAYISTNGYLTFNALSGAGCCSSPLLPSAGTLPDNLVALDWVDLNTSSGGNIDYFNLTSPNRFVVRYNAVSVYLAGGGTGQVSGQIILYQDGTIEVHSTSVTTNYAAHPQSQGIENAGGTLATTVPGRNSVVGWTATNDAYRFSPPTGTFAYTWSTSGPGVLSSTTTNPTTGTSITGNTTYNVIVTNGACIATGSVAVAPGGPLGTAVTATPPSSASAYCTPIYTSYDGTDYISNVTLNGSPAINNTSGATVLPGYSPFLGISTTLAAGGTFTISVTDGSFGSNENLTAFSDYNQDGVFNVATEQILPNFITTAAFQTTTASFTVPANAINGTTRLRVVDNYFTTPAPPCPTAGFGETEDYTINITGGITPSALVCPGLPWTLSAVITGGGAPYTILWSGDPAATAGLITNNTATVTAIPLAPTTYSVLITDNCGITATQSVFVNVRVTTPTIGTVTASSASGCGVTPAPPNISGAPVTFAVDAFTGDNLIWQFNVNGGAWTTIPGALTSPISLVPTIPQGGGPVTFGLRAQSYFCAINPATSNAVTFIMDDPAAPTAVTGGARCGPGIVPVTASVPAGQTVEWYTAATGGTLLAIGSSYNYPATASTTIYAADRNPSSGCLGSLRRGSSITVNNIPTVTASSNSPVCVPNAINLTGTSGSIPVAGGTFNNGVPPIGGSNAYPFNTGTATPKLIQWFVAPGEVNSPAPATPGTINSISFFALTTGSATFTNFTIRLGQASSPFAGGSIYAGPMTAVVGSANMLVSSPTAL